MTKSGHRTVVKTDKARITGHKRIYRGFNTFINLTVGKDNDYQYQKHNRHSSRNEAVSFYYRNLRKTLLRVEIDNRKVEYINGRDHKKYHANPLPGVNEMIKECHLKNYSIYSRGDYLFSYFEYDGDDYDADMEKMAADPATQHWWSIVKPLMQPLDDRKEGEFWSDMEEIYHLD